MDRNAAYNDLHVLCILIANGQVALAALDDEVAAISADTGVPTNSLYCALDEIAPQHGVEL